MFSLSLLEKFPWAKAVADVIREKQELKLQNEELKRTLINLKNRELPKEAEYWNNKHPKVFITYKGRTAPNTKRMIDVPLQCFLQPNDPVIVRDILENKLAVDNPLHCNDAILRIYKHTRTKPLNPYRYAYDNDIMGIPEFWMLPFELREALKGDCFPEGTKMLRENGDIVEVQEIIQGDRIIGGKGKIVEVTNTWDRGMKDMLAISLNNGDILKLSTTHKLLIAESKDKFAKNEFVEKQAEELEIGDSIPFPNEINLNPIMENWDIDFSYLAGLYIADGWIHGNVTYIAGRDGKKKEAQKMWVMDFCQKRNIEFAWHHRYIRIKSKEITDLLKTHFGLGTFGKKVPHNMAASSIKPFLDGWKADARERDAELTYSTANPNLAISLRILWRRLGYQVAIKCVEHHGGFSKNPIFRICVHREKTKRIIIKDIKPIPQEYCYDVSTTDGMVYLPEHDIEVRQCDDWGNELASYYIAAGVPNWRIRCVIGNCWAGGGHHTVYVLADDFKTWHHTNSTTPITMLVNVTKLESLPTSNQPNDGIGIKEVWFSYNDQFAWHKFETEITDNRFKIGGLQNAVKR